MDDYRHHRVQVIFVETPVAGSPKVVRSTKPGNYPRNPPTHWQPRTRPPSKAERSVQLLKRICEQEAELHRFMDLFRRDRHAG